MKLKSIGFFKELRHGSENGESIHVAKSKTPLENENKIINYLNNGVIFCICPGFAYDVLDASKGIICNLEVRTDGEWAWPSDLSYYVKHYHVKLNADFITHMAKNKWEVPNKNYIDTLKAEL